MRVSVVISSLVAAMAAVCVNATPTATTNSAPVKRFAFKGATGSDNLTPAQRYARDLMRRAPTRRTTAKKRQESATVGTPQAVSVGLTNSGSGSFLGFASLGPNGLEVSPDSGTSFTVLADPTWVVLSDQGIRIPDITYPNLGLVQRPGESPILGPGLSTAVLLAGVTTSTLPSASPTLMVNAITGVADLLVETDVWRVDFTTGIMTPVWTNFDSSRIELTTLTDGVSIIATGDADAFNAANGNGWFPISLAFSVDPL